MRGEGRLGVEEGRGEDSEVGGNLGCKRVFTWNRISRVVELFMGDFG